MQEEAFEKLIDYLFVAIDAGFFTKDETDEICRLIREYGVQDKKEN